MYPYLFSTHKVTNVNVVTVKTDETTIMAMAVDFHDLSTRSLVIGGGEGGGGDGGDGGGGGVSDGGGGDKTPEEVVTPVLICVVRLVRLVMVVMLVLFTSNTWFKSEDDALTLFSTIMTLVSFVITAPPDTVTLTSVVLLSDGESIVALLSSVVAFTSDVVVLLSVVVTLPSEGEGAVALPSEGEEVIASTPVLFASVVLVAVTFSALTRCPIVKMSNKITNLYFTCILSYLKN